MYADGRTVFVEPVDVFDSSDFVRIVANGRGATMTLTSGARLRPYRVGDLAVVMKGNVVVDTLRDFVTPRDDGAPEADHFDLSNVGIDRLCARTDQH